MRALARQVEAIDRCGELVGPFDDADGAMIADVVAHSLATAVSALLETWMSKGGEDVDGLNSLTDIALCAVEEGLTHTLRDAGLH